MRMPESTTEEKLMKYTILNGLNRDFISASTTYAKTIISEYFLDTNLKSVKVEQIGGFAGGKKFMWRGILFKVRCICIFLPHLIVMTNSWLQEKIVKYMATTMIMLPRPWAMNLKARIHIFDVEFLTFILDCRHS